MLNEHDAEWIKANRAEITQGRTEPITITQRTQSGTDPFTQDPVYSTQEVTIDVTWGAATGGEDVKYVNGVEVQAGDFIAGVPITIDLSNVGSVRKNGVEYRIIAKDSVGLAGDNRIETLVRRVV